MIYIFNGRFRITLTINDSVSPILSDLIVFKFLDLAGQSRFGHKPYQTEMSAILIVILVVVFVFCCKKYKNARQSFNTIPGPTSYPLIGEF